MPRVTKRIQKSSLPIEVVVRLSKIFHDKNWPMFSDEPAEDPNLFEKFCQTLTYLDEDEQELILATTEEFLRCTYNSYPHLMVKALQSIDQSLFDDLECVFLLPLISPKDIQKGQTKSGHPLLYVAYHNIIHRLPYLGRKVVKAYEILSTFYENHRNRSNSLLIFLDDFIGTGNTACECLEEYYNSYHIETDSVVIVALVAQEQGILAIRDLGLEVYASQVRKRGISDSEKFPDIDKALDIMDKIEERLDIKNRYRRGYGQSEALVSMIRTPNNTFPVYWCTKAKQGGPWPAPFRR